ncbi:hypothetical protein G9A89_016988 [Geosiphon pyriformis]|nr:hypothetical protein G9A89_016988 [Geosiphon pyriformis]
MCNVRGLNNPVKQNDLADKFDSVQVFTSGLDFGSLGVEVLIIMNFSLAKHVCKVSEVPGWLLSIKFLFKNKLSVSILGLYAGVSSVVWFSQAGEVNSFIAKAINKSFFVIFGGDFNENDSHKCASFKKCFNLGLINSLGGSSFVKSPTWYNFHGITKTINYMFISSNLVGVVVDHGVNGIENYFDTNHNAVYVFVSLGGLFDLEFRNATAANAVMFSDEFVAAKQFSDLDAIWDIVHKIMVFSAGGMFKKKWFKSFNCVFNKVSFQFHKLELLVSKLVKASWLVSDRDFALLLNTWNRLDSVGTLSVKSLFLSGAGFDAIRSGLAKVRKSYRSSKLLESKYAEESHIRQAIERRMESFEVDKGHTIRSVLEHPFCKVVLDHLVDGGELVLEPDLVKSKVNGIMEGWTRKCVVASDISGDWARQFRLLDHIFNSAFSDVMHLIGFDEMFSVISNLPDGKVAGLSDQISLACSTFDVLRGDNFSVLKGMSTHSPIFAIGSVIEDVLEKNQELWLVLQNMCKAYDSVGWKHLKRSLIRVKMCDKFIRFFGSIHNGHTNKVMTDFGLTDKYHVHNGLDQEEVFSPLFLCIFYDSLLCEVKRQESICGYRLMSFLATGAFVDNTIWVGSSQAATQHILNIASDFFHLNDILINNDKTVAIPINCQVTAPYLTISNMPIFIVKKGEPHCYLGIFLFSEGLSKPSLVKAHSDVRFFVNLILRKVISDKQFAYLVSTVLFPIVSYRTQFSFIPLSVCNKWDTLIHKGLKSKSGLPLNFPNDALYYLSLYNLKTFEQIQTESKSASVIAFANSVGVLGYLFSHRSHDLQVLSWHPRHPLLFPVCIRISPSNNFLADVVHIFFVCDLSLGGSLASVFCFWSGTPMFLVFGETIFFKCVFFLRHYGIAFIEQLCDQNGIVFDWKTFKHWKKLDFHGLVPFWFDFSVRFLGGVASLSGYSPHEGVCGSSDIHQSPGFGVICNDLLNVGAARLSVYTDGSLSNLGTVDMLAGAAVFFEDINSGLDVRVSGLVSSTLVELQAIALALECVLSFYSVDLFSDSQAALDACRSESLLVGPNFRNRCWIEHHHITNVIHRKNLDVKGHLGVSDNKQTDVLAKNAALSAWHLLHLVSERFLKAGVDVVFGNLRHFVRDVFRSINCMHWKVGSGSQVVLSCLRADIDWLRSFLVWHPDSHMATCFTSIWMTGFRTYFMKALYYHLLVAVQKHLYDRGYPSVVCLFCGEVEVLDHVFSCSSDIDSHAGLLDTYAAAWKDPKVAMVNVVNFVCEFCLAFRDNIWLVCMKHQTIMEKNKLIPRDGSISVAVSGFSTWLSVGMIRLLDVADALGISFGYCKYCLFYAGIDNLASVHISA